MFFILAKLDTDRKTIVLAACACARLALRYVHAGEERPRIAIETAEAWTRGEATIEQVLGARDAAYAYAYAAASAANAAAAAAAYAAAYAAYAAAAADTYAAAADAAAAAADTYACAAADAAAANAYAADAAAAARREMRLACCNEIRRIVLMPALPLRKRAKKAS